MVEFEKMSVADALEVSIAAATHLTDRDAGAIAAARALAKKVDAWDLIVQWALEDAMDSRSRPKVPVNDNVSLPTLLKFLQALQLVPPVEKVQPGPASSASPEQQALNDMRKGLHAVS